MRKSVKMYVLLYLVVLVLRIRRARRQGKVRRYLVKLGKDFMASLAFMSGLVGGMKTALCLINKTQTGFQLRYLPLLPLLGSLSLLFNDTTKQSQISYFVVVRAIRSAYILCKKRLHFPIARQRQLCFIAIFMGLSYLYFQGDANLRHRGLLVNLWGDF